MRDSLQLKENYEMIQNTFFNPESPSYLSFVSNYSNDLNLNNLESVALSILKQQYLEFPKSEEYEQYMNKLNLTPDPEELNDEKRKSKVAFAIPPNPIIDEIKQPKPTYLKHHSTRNLMLNVEESNKNLKKTSKSKKSIFSKLKLPSIQLRNIPSAFHNWGINLFNLIKNGRDVTTDTIVVDRSSIPLKGEKQQNIPKEENLTNNNTWNRVSISLRHQSLSKSDTFQIGNRNRSYTSTQIVLQKCIICEDSIGESGEYFKINGKPVHKECFKCHSCNENLENLECILRKGCLFCLINCGRDVLDKCVVCNEIILGEYLVYKDKKYHVNCLKCTECRCNLKGQFFTIDLNPYCFVCAEKMNNVIDNGGV